MLILDSNSKFRNHLLNLDIHNFSLVPYKISRYNLGYPWVMTPLGNALQTGNDKKSPPKFGETVYHENLPFPKRNYKW